MGSRVMLETTVSVACYLFLFAEVAHLGYIYFKRRRSKGKNDLEIRKPGHLWNTALFFPSQDELSQNQLLWYLNNATRSLKICMYSFTSKSIENLLYEKKQKGVQIEIITMARFADWLNMRGYCVRVKPPTCDDELMHHKFVIIDEEALITGSLNWSEGLFGNHENVMVTSNDRAVKTYLEEFQNLWSLSQCPASEAQTNYQH